LEFTGIKRKYIVVGYTGGLISYVTSVFRQESPKGEHKVLYGLIYTKFFLNLNSDKSMYLIMK